MWKSIHSAFLMILLVVQCGCKSQKVFTQSDSTYDTRPMSREINVDTAASWVNNHIQSRPIFTGAQKIGAWSSFDKKALIKMLSLPGVEGIKVYYARDEKLPDNFPSDFQDRKNEKEARIILMPVDKDGRDLIKYAKDKPNEKYQYYLLTSTMRCPYNCDME